MQDKAAICLHGPAKVNGLTCGGLDLQLKIDLVKQGAQANVRRSVDHQAHRPAVRVVAEVYHAAGKVIVDHAGHGDQELIGQVLRVVAFFCHVLILSD